MSDIIANMRTVFISLINIWKIIWRFAFEGWTIWHFLNFSNLLKALLFYSAAVVGTIINFDFSENFWSNSFYRVSDRSGVSEFIVGKKLYDNSKQSNTKRVSIYSVNGRIGEGMLYDRMIEYFEDNNYEYTGSKLPEYLLDIGVVHHFFKVTASLLNFLLEPDFTLALTHHVKIVPYYGYNIVYLNMSRHDLYSPNEVFVERFDHLNKYDAFADLYTLSNGKNNILEKIAAGRPIIPLYLADRKSDYKKLDFKKLLINGSLWGCGRYSIRLRLALKKLAEEDLLDAVGLDVYEYLGKNYLGQIEDWMKENAGKQNQLKVVKDALSEIHRRYGIGLIVHSSEHMIDGIPTNRLAETAMNSLIIISDRNKFIEKYFDDSVLFFDINENEEEIYGQIKNHIDWIKSHPDEAQKMAQKSNRLFSEKFSIEVQMENLYRFLQESRGLGSL